MKKKYDVLYPAEVTEFGRNVINNKLDEAIEFIHIGFIESTSIYCIEDPFPSSTEAVRNLHPGDVIHINGTYFMKVEKDYRVIDAVTVKQKEGKPAPAPSTECTEEAHARWCPSNELHLLNSSVSPIVFEDKV